MKSKIFRFKPFRRDKRAMSPAISTVIVTSAVIILVLVAMMYSNNFLSASIAQNEFAVSKQFMLTTALQIDDIAWIAGRAQTVRYASRYGTVSFQDNVLNYTFAIKVNGAWTDVFTQTTGAIMFSMPTNEPMLGDAKFANLSSTSRAINQTGPSAPIANVFAIERGTATGDNIARVVAVPTIRMLNSTVGSQSYVKFYIPMLQKGTIAQSYQSVTLIGQPSTKYVYSNVTDARFTVTYPAVARGFDSAFFNFEHTAFGKTIVTIPLNANSVVDFYLGAVTVSLGLYE